MNTLTEVDKAKIAAWLEEHPVLSVGVGTEEEACSVAAINLALTGELTDDIPDCMSEVIGNWIIATQDWMPAEIRDSKEWRALLPDAAGTGRAHEQERLNIIFDWMYEALERLQPVADEHGFGDAWRAALEERTEEALDTAWAAARDAAEAAEAAEAAARAAGAAWAAARAARAAAWAVRDATGDAAGVAVAWAAVLGAAAEARTAVRDARDAAWTDFHTANDYPGLLRRLIAVSGGEK